MVGMSDNIKAHMLSMYPLALSMQTVSGAETAITIIQQDINSNMLSPSLKLSFRAEKTIPAVSRQKQSVNEEERSDIALKSPETSMSRRCFESRLSDNSSAFFIRSFILCVPIAFAGILKMKNAVGRGKALIHELLRITEHLFYKGKGIGNESAFSCKQYL